MKTSLKARLAITRQVKEAIRTGYAWPGGYPLSVVMDDGEAICPDCAKENWEQVAHDTIKGWRTGWQAAGVEVLWEGGNHCANCDACLDAYPEEETATL